MASFPLLSSVMLASPPVTAEQVMAAHRARTSVARPRQAEDCEREGEAFSDDEVIVCAARDDDRYRVPASEPGMRPGDGVYASVDAGRASFATCALAQPCGKPMIKVIGIPFGPGAGNKSKTGVIAHAVALISGQD